MNKHDIEVLRANWELKREQFKGDNHKRDAGYIGISRRQRSPASCGVQIPARLNMNPLAPDRLTFGLPVGREVSGRYV